MNEKLISADYLFAKIDKWVLDCDGISFEELKKTLNNAPAVDAVEVRHGYWDDSGRYAFLDGSPAIRCSQCGCSLHKDEYDEYYWRYCPCCGSLMGERREKNAVD